MSKYVIVDENTLQHHGILGMHWGIRRFQPYPKGYHGNGKEVGAAKRVKQRDRIPVSTIGRYINYKKNGEKLVKKNLQEIDDRENTSLLTKNYEKKSTKAMASATIAAGPLAGLLVGKLMQKSYENKLKKVIKQNMSEINKISAEKKFDKLLKDDKVRRKIEDIIIDDEARRAAIGMMMYHDMDPIARKMYDASNYRKNKKYYK